MFRWYLSLPLHLRIAILVAPFLAIAGYGMADLWKRPEVLQQGVKEVAIFELVAEGQCLLATDQCKLAYEGLSVQLAAVPASSDGLVRFNIRSPQLIRGVKMALVQEGVEEHLVSQDVGDSETWFAEFPRKILKGTDFTIRLAVAQTKRLLVAEFPAKL